MAVRAAAQRVASRPRPSATSGRSRINPTPNKNSDHAQAGFSQVLEVRSAGEFGPEKGEVSESGAVVFGGVVSVSTVFLKGAEFDGVDRLVIVHGPKAQVRAAEREREGERKDEPGNEGAAHYLARMVHTRTVAQTCKLFCRKHAEQW